MAFSKNLLNEKLSWSNARLDELCEIDPSKREIAELDKNLRVSFGMMADLGEHKRRFEPQETKTLNELKKGGYSYFRENDVLVAKMTPCFENGKSGIALNLENEIGFGSTEFYVLRTKENVIPDWIYHIVSSHKFLNEGRHSMIGTTGRRRLMKQFVESFNIPLPPIEIQQKIVSLFNSIENSSEQAEEQEKNLRALAKRLIDGLISDEPTFGNLLESKELAKVKFADVADCINKHEKQPLDLGLDCFVGLEHIEPEKFRISTWGNIEDGTTFTKTFASGDVLFCKRRSYLKKVAIAEFDGICSSDILVFRAKEIKMIAELLPFYAASESFIQYAVNTSAGSLSPRTKWRDLAKFELTIPDLETQAKILEVLQQVQTTIEQTRQQKETLKNLKFKLLNEILG